MVPHQHFTAQVAYINAFPQCLFYFHCSAFNLFVLNLNYSFYLLHFLLILLDHIKLLIWLRILNCLKDFQNSLILILQSSKLTCYNSILIRIFIKLFRMLDLV